ncbi:hypothetical protein ACS0TY_023533 [Phlomoides rotata]
MGSSRATESAAPISGGGGGGGATSTVTNNPIKDDAVDSSPFQLGELVLAFHGHCLYDAKVQKVESYDEGWRWDEWLDVDFLLKYTDENVQNKKEILKIYLEKNTKPRRLSQDKTNSSMGVRGRKRKQEIIKKEEDIAQLEKFVNIQIPSTLKKQLIDDQDCITHLGKLVKLPRTPNVHEILNKYFDYRVRMDGMIGETLKEIVKGLHCYFDKALPAMLLYKEERQQYREVITENDSPSDVYGAEHLLRLFVKLPEMLAGLHIEKETLTELQQKWLDFLRFLQSNQREFFDLSDRKCGEDSPTAVKEEDK